MSYAAEPSAQTTAGARQLTRRARPSLITIATYSCVAEAEIARGRLVAAGYRARLADQYVAGVHELVSPIIGGVKLQVPETQVARALHVLAMAVTRPGPVFRVVANQAGPYALAGLGLGFLAAVVMCAFQVTALPALWLAVAGWLIGSAMGRKHRMDFCSSPQCGAPLAPEVDTCPCCGGSIMGTIQDRNDRLEAEESLRLPPAAQPRLP